jgi:hypothetical protein
MLVEYLSAEAVEEGVLHAPQDFPVRLLEIALHGSVPFEKVDKSTLPRKAVRKRMDCKWNPCKE